MRSVQSIEDLLELSERLRQLDGRSRGCFNLVPSENAMSPLARSALAGDWYHRYFFNQQHDPEFWEFRGGEPVATIETDVAVGALRRLSRAEHVNVRPISGMSAMIMVLAALGGEVGAAVISVSTASGGHYATPSVVERLGFRSIEVPIARGAFCQDDLATALRKHPVELVYFDLANSLHPPDVTGAVEVIRAVRPQASLHVDASHILGLVLGGALSNPLDEGATSMGGSTHKTFPGPQKGIFCTRDAGVAERVQAAQFYLISSHHFAETLALGLAAAEFEHFGTAYAAQVVSNARALADALAEQGFRVLRADGAFPTYTHQVWVDAESREGDTVALSDCLAEVGVRVNIQRGMPGNEGPLLRLGSNEMTFFGATERSMRRLALCFATARDADLEASREHFAACRDTFGPPYFTRNPRLDR